MEFHEILGKQRKERLHKAILEDEQKPKVKATEYNQDIYKNKSTLPSKTTHAWELKIEHQKTQKEAEKLIQEMTEQERLDQDERRRVYSFYIAFGSYTSNEVG